MSNTITHSLLASMVAIPTDHNTLPVKLMVLGTLALSHVPLDALPHVHFYNFADLRQHFVKNVVGASVELGGGLIILPLIIYFITGVDLWWLVACVFSASLLDFLVAAGIKPAQKFNHWIHWWNPHVGNKLAVLVFGELLQIFIVIFMTYVYLY